MADRTQIVFDLKDLQLLMEQVRVDLLSVPVGSFLGRTDDDTVDDFNLIYESVLTVISETDRSQRKSQKVSTSAPGATVTATAIATVSM